jgi:hypothetical protein
MKSLAYATLFALALTPSHGFAQDSTGHKMSDEELIKLSLSAAPEAVARDATVVAMDHDGKMRTCAKEPGSGRACQVTPIRPTLTRCAAIKTQWNGGRPG